MKNDAQRVAMNTGILYARMVITVFLSLYTTRLILKALGTEDFGIFNLVGGTIAMLTFLNASMAGATQRFMSFAQGQGDELRQRSIFNVSMVLHAIIAFVILGIMEGTGFILFNGVIQIEPKRLQAAWMVYQFAAASMFFTVLSVPYDAVINARENMILFATLSIMESFFKLGIAILILNVATDRLVVYGFLMAFLSVVLLLVRILYCHIHYHECKFSQERCINRPLFKEMTSFAGWSLLGSSTSMIGNYGQGLVLNIFFGTKVNAAQGIANQVSGQLGALAFNMLKALNPLIGKSEGAGKREIVIAASMMGSKIGFFLMMILYIPILLEMPYVFKIWLTYVPEYAIDFCTLLLLRDLIGQLVAPLVTSISAVGNIKMFQVITSINNIIALIISALLFYLGYSAVSLYWVFIGHAILLLIITLEFSVNKFGLPLKVFIESIIIRCLLTFILTTGFSIFPLFLLPQSGYRFITTLCLSMTISLIFIVLIGFSKDEIKKIRSTLLLFVNKSKNNHY